MNKLQKIIVTCFGILFFLVPIILWPTTSELFEFNKMVVTYLLTVAISALWIMRMNYEKRIIFRRTILDTPLLIFFASQLISTLISIDTQTSWFGYYSRFNGGLLSTISYLLLYWSFVSNVDKDDIKKLIDTIFWSATLVAIYGVLERLGIDKNVWQQTVQHRVFSTLGQPNWLAAWLVALIPITWTRALSKNTNKTSFGLFVPYLLSTLFFSVLIFTGSRSGLFGFFIAWIVYWSIVFIKSRLTHFRRFFIINGSIAVIALVFGTQFSPSVIDLLKNSKQVTEAEVKTSTALETGGTESGDIRKIVWQGALEVWRHYPILGTGVETFAYSYYLFRPAAHNMTSEWDFIYNKAHNEYLNFMANSGTVGILSYLGVVVISLYIIFKKITTKGATENIHLEFLLAAIGSGYVSILVTNFFGFSVVPIQLLFYIYPAIAIILALYEADSDNSKATSTRGPALVNWIVIVAATYMAVAICRYWYADHLYAMGVNSNRINKQNISPDYLVKAIKIEPNQSIYYSELAKSLAGLALSYSETDATTASQFADAAIANSIRSVELSPANVNLKRVEFGIYAILAGINPGYFINARDVLIDSVAQAPTDAKLMYNLGLVYSRTGDVDMALQTMEKTILLKSNYRDARLAYGILLNDAKRYNEAKMQFEYILTNIDPNDTIAKQYLQGIK